MSFPDQDAGTLTNIPIGFLHENSMRSGESDVTLGVSSVPCRGRERRWRRGKEF